MNVLLGTLFSILYAGLILGAGEAVTRFTRVPREIVRKVMHLLLGGIVLILYYYFRNSVLIFLVPLLFLAINLLLYFLKPLQSLQREKKDLGIVFYALSCTVMSALTAYDNTLILPFVIAVACMSFGDCFAGIAGIFLRPRIQVFASKTLFGALACFVASAVGINLALWLFGFPEARPVSIVIYGTWGRYVLPILFLSLVSTLSEVFATGGLDNATVPLWTFAWAIGIYLDVSVLPLLLVCYTAYLVFVVCAKKTLTVPAAMAAVAIIFMVWMNGGLSSLISLLLTFGITVLVERATRAARIGHAEPVLAERRTLSQVICNSLPSIACCIIYSFTTTWWLPLVAIAGFAESMTDSVASALGRLSTTAPRRITSWKSTKAGISGGVTPLGTFCSWCILTLFAVIVLVLDFSIGDSMYLSSIHLAYYLDPHIHILLSPVEAMGNTMLKWRLLSLLVLFITPFLGMLFDSLLGDTLQAKYRCPTCGAISDNTLHCGRPAIRASGCPFFTNSRVNLLSNAFTVAMAAALMHLLTILLP